MNRNDDSELERWLVSSGLVVPPFPEPLIASVKRCTKYVFSSRLEVASPYNYAHYVSEARESALADYVLVGHAGHGINSYALSYYVAWNGLRLLLQLAWGGVYMDGDTTARRIRSVFETLHQLWPLVSAHYGTPRRPLIIATSDFYGGVFERHGESPERWRPDKGGALRALSRLAAEIEPRMDPA